MKLPYSWIKEYTDINVPVKEYSHRMTMTGSKVESWENKANEISRVVVGKIISVAPHGDSDHLMVCMVDVGGASPLQIVSGAPNLHEGDMVPVALEGAILPAGEIKKTTMRGVDSFGMLCSFSELDLTENDCPYGDPKGILVFPPDMNASIGDDALKLLAIDEDIIEFEITPNRPDCLCAIGIARETAASFEAKLNIKDPVINPKGGKIEESLKVSIANPDLCPRYTAGMVENVRLAPSPHWMRNRLRNAGIRPINNIVDITNYVMLEYGQPMHAFDYSCIDEKEIVVRTNFKGEQVVTLDGQTRLLADNTLLITDPKKAIGIAGVMGGENSEITGKTQMVVFESACFSGPAVRIASRKIGMRTEASGRFEKGLDTENTMPALLRALQLVEELDAGDVLQGIIDVYPAPKQKKQVAFDTAFINRLLGTQIERGEMEKSLISLGFEVAGDTVSVPSWRDDIEGVADLAEEVGRIYGFDKIESTLYASKGAIGGFSKRQRFENSLAQSCRQWGFYEGRSVSFMSPKDLADMNLNENSPLLNTVKIINPLGEEHSLMRTSLLPALLAAANRNISYREEQFNLFELAMTYFPHEGKDPDALPTEKKMLAAAAYGDVDFFAIKGFAENLLADNGIESPRFVPQKSNPIFHPGRAADIYSGDTLLGTLGQVHPFVCANYDIEKEIYYIELFVDNMFDTHQSQKVYSPMPRFPAVTRDLAVVCDKSAYAADLEGCIAASAGATLEKTTVFDVFEGRQIGEDKKSIAFALTFRSPDHTMTDKEIDIIIENVLSALKTQYNAILRS